MGFAGAVVAAGIGAGAGLYEQKQAQKEADKAMNAPKPDLPQHPTGLTDSATNLSKANLLAQQAGGSLLSDPVKDAQEGKTGTLPSNGKSLLGS